MRTIGLVEHEAIEEFLKAMGRDNLPQALEEALALIAPASVTGNPSITFGPVTVREEGVGLEYRDNTGKRRTEGREIRSLVARARICGKVVTLDAHTAIPLAHMGKEPEMIRKHADQGLRNKITRAMIERAYP